MEKEKDNVSRDKNPRFSSIYTIVGSSGKSYTSILES